MNDMGGCNEVGLPHTPPSCPRFSRLQALCGGGRQNGGPLAYVVSAEDKHLLFFIPTPQRKGLQILARPARYFGTLSWQIAPEENVVPHPGLLLVLATKRAVPKSLIPCLWSAYPVVPYQRVVERADWRQQRGRQQCVHQEEREGGVHRSGAGVLLHRNLWASIILQLGPSCCPAWVDSSWGTGLLKIAEGQGVFTKENNSTLHHAD